MGDAETRARYREVLLAYWREHASLLGAEMERAEANPLRILDSKRDDWQDMLETAPQLGDYLTDASAADFETVQAGLQRARDPRSRSRPGSCAGSTTTRAPTFEFQSDALDAAQNAIGGGGRYDGLVEQMGGKPTPGIGFGIGIERVLLVCDAEGVLPAPAAAVDVFVVDTVGGLASLHAARRAARARVCPPIAAYGNRSMKKQWGAADRSGARWGVILAPRELADGKVAVKDLASRRAGRGAARRGRGLAAHEKGRRAPHDAHASSRRPARRATSAERRGVCGGSRTAATTAATCSSTSATPPALVQVVVDPEQPGSRSRTACAASGWCASSGTVRPRPEGTVNADLPTGAVEVGRDGGRGAERGRAVAVPARRPRRRRRGAAAAAPLSRPAARADAAQPARARRR